MGELRRVVEGPEDWEHNVMPPMVEAVRAGATEREICDFLREVFGRYEDPGTY